MPELIYPVYLSIANFRHAARSIFPLPVRGIDSIWRMLDVGIWVIFQISFFQLGKEIVFR